MAETPTLEYFLLQYAQNAVSDEGRNIGLVVVDPNCGFCRTRFRADWQEVVQSADPEADLEMLAHLLRDVEERLLNPQHRGEMLQLMEDSFSNCIRVSARRTRLAGNAEEEVERLVSAFL